MREVIVTGTSTTVLAAALECAQVGIRVRIAPEAEGEQPNPLGIRSAGVRDEHGAFTEFLEHVSAPIGEGGAAEERTRPHRTAPTAVALRGRTGSWGEQPWPSVVGIPAVPLATKTTALIGGRASARAYLDRVKPVLTIGKESQLSHLVETRVGAVARELLVEPFVFERFGRQSTDVEVATAAPGLNEALTRVGSLTGAVLATAPEAEAHETLVRPVAGWDELRAALLERLEPYGAEMLPAPLASLRRDGDAWVGRDITGHEFRADAVIVDADHALAATPGDLADALQALSTEPAQHRAIAETVIASPDRELASLELATDGAGHTWSIRTRKNDDGTWHAEIAGEVFAAGADMLTAETASMRMGEALQSVALEPREAIGARIEVAPFARRAERDAAEAACAEFAEAELTLLMCGPALHGADLAAAVGDARAQAQIMRRRLVGISK